MLGLSERHIYRLIQQLRAANGELTALLPKGPKGGRGQRRLSPSRESAPALDPSGLSDPPEAVSRRTHP
nr:hypothetical protein [Klebsiella quasipneumoniae]